MSKYGALLRVSLSERLVYRGNFFISTLFRFLPIITSVMLWSAVFAGSGKDRIGGFRYPDMVGYYRLAMLARAFSSMTNLANTVALDIRNGLRNKFLLKPVDYLVWMLAGRVAHKIVYFLMAAAPLAVVIGLLRSRGYFPDWPGGTVFAAFLVSVFLGFLIGYFIHFLMGLIAFWLLEVTSFLFLLTMFEYFMSGHMIPLDLYPPALRAVCESLPFQFEAYVPVAIFVGRIPVADIPARLLAQAGWVIALFVTCRAMFTLGVRRYAAVGG